MNTQYRVIIIDSSPGDLLYEEISDFLDQQLSVTVNINKVHNLSQLKDLFQNRIEYVDFDINNELDFIREIARENQGYHIIKLRLSTKIDKEIIRAAVSKKLRNKLRIIAQIGTGVNHIDCKVATEFGVFVTNTPGSNSNAVAELVIALMLILSRSLFYHNYYCHKGRWSREVIDLNNFELEGKILGIIGVGNVANKLIPKAKALGMKVITYSVLPSYDKSKPSAYTKIDNFSEFMSSADFVSIHIPYTENTKNLIGTKELRLMKKGSILINTARGGIINEVALAKELKNENSNIKGAALDVHQNENLKYFSPLMGLDNVILTPHIGGTTTEALRAASKRLAENVVEILRGNYKVSIVNKELIKILSK